MRKALAVGALGLLAASCATLRPDGALDRSAAERGRAFAQRSCAGCHAVAGRTPSPNSHAPAFQSLAATRSDAQLAEALAAIPREGHVEMPPIYITPGEQRDLAAYLRSLRGRA